MADKTFDVKISDDLHNKVMRMINSSGVTSKEWFEKAVVLTEIHGLNIAVGDHNEYFSELEVHTTRIHELVANMIKREVYLKEELETKNEDIASIATSLEYNNKEIAELYKQIEEMRTTNENNQSLNGLLSRLVAEQEIQLKDLKEVIGTKEKVIGSFAASLENSKMENAELHKQVDAMKVTNANNQSLIGEYKEKINSLSGLAFEREVQLKDLKEVLAARLENSTKENAELHKQVDAMKVTNKNNLSLIGEYKEKINSLSGLVVEREVQLKDLKEVGAARLENSTIENAELHKQVDAMKVTNANNQSLIGEYKEKIDSLSGQVDAMKVTNKNNLSLIGEYKEKINSLSGQVVEREVQLKDLKEVLAARLENSTKENAELHKQVDAMKVTYANNQSLIGEYKEKIDSLSGQVDAMKVTNANNQSLIGEYNEKIDSLSGQVVAMKVTNENNQSLIGEYKAKIDSLSGQVDAMKVTNENSQSLIGEYKAKIDSLSGQIVEREVQLKDLKEVLAARLENSTKKNAELHKQKGKMKATNKNNQTLTEYKEKIDSWLASPLTNHQSEPQAKEEKSLQKAEWKSQKKKLKQLLKEHPNAKENELAELLGVDSSYVIELRKEFGI
ncbi:UNVERIFIED_ORG: chromosome segregation ATPase [Peribacillus simplex]